MKRKHIDTFKERILKEKLEVVNQENIIIKPFDNELEDRENWELDQRSGNRPFDKNELMKLNIYFGVLKNPVRNYEFKFKSGGFGQEKFKFNGVINKKSEYDYKTKELSDEIYYIINGYLSVEFGPHKGNRLLNLKFDNFDDVISFFKTFKDNFQIQI